MQNRRNAEALNLEELMQIAELSLCVWRSQFLTVPCPSTLCRALKVERGRKKPDVIPERKMDKKKGKLGRDQGQRELRIAGEVLGAKHGCAQGVPSGLDQRSVWRRTLFPTLASQVTLAPLTLR